MMQNKLKKRKKKGKSLAHENTYTEKKYHFQLLMFSLWKVRVSAPARGQAERELNK